MSLCLTDALAAAQDQPAAYSEGSDAEICEDLTKSPLHGTMSAARLNRKRRRGFIEKRRRDRINNCLNELKRLVPRACERQGAQKLEKAEILQLTVDHLRTVNSQDNAATSGTEPEPGQDWQSMGFRECASEVARFMAAEGLDVQDPLRVRLMNHLQTQLSYMSQRSVPVPSYSSTPPLPCAYDPRPLPVAEHQPYLPQDYYQQYDNSPLKANAFGTQTIPPGTAAGVLPGTPPSLPQSVPYYAPPELKPFPWTDPRSYPMTSGQ